MAFVCESLFIHGKSSVTLKLKPKLLTTALHDCLVGIRYISYLLDISLKMINRCGIFKAVGQVIPQQGPAVREASFQIGGAWFGQGRLSLREVVSRVTLREKTFTIP